MASKENNIKNDPNFFKSVHDIIEIEKPTNTPYFILETLSKDNDLPQGLYVVHIISDEPIKLV